MLPRKKLKLAAAVFTALLIGVYIFLRFIFVPHILEPKANGLEQHFTSQDLSKVPAFHQDLFISDLHADTLLWNRPISERSSRGHVDIPRLIEGNIALQAFSIVTQAPRNISVVKNENNSDNIFWLAAFSGWPLKSLTRLSERALYQIGKLHQARRERNDFFIITSRNELIRYLEKRKENPKITAGWLSIEGAQALEGDLQELNDFYEAGVRMISPAHLTDSNMSGSQQGAQKYGLTELGKAWLKKMDEKKMIIDLAHASAATIDDVIELSTRAPLVSHTGVQGVCPTNRNLTDEQIKKIAQKGGLIGVGFWSEATCGQDLQSIVKSILHVKDLVGIEHVALGSDWDGYVWTPIDAAQMGLLSLELHNSGLSQKEIALIMGQNTLQFLLNYLPE